MNLSTHTDRTIYFDLLPVELGDIKGYKIRFQLATVPGQTAFNETRKVVLKGADGVVFVADSQWTMLPKNLEAWQNLKDNLKANGVAFEGMPVVIQYNKRDLNDILSIEAMQEALGLSSFPFVEAVASAGRGVTETFKLISKLTFVDLLRRLQGRRPEEASLPTGKESKDDLQSWRQSLFTRVDAREPRRPRPLAAVPSPSEEAPFETGEPPAEAAPAPEGPFASREAAARPEAARPTPEPLEIVDEVDAAAPELLPEPEPAVEIEAVAEKAVPAAPLPPPERAAAPAPPAFPPKRSRSSKPVWKCASRRRFSRRATRCNRPAPTSRAWTPPATCWPRAWKSPNARRAMRPRRFRRHARPSRRGSRPYRTARRASASEIARIHELSERVEETAARLDGHEQRLVSGFEKLAAAEKEIGAQDKRQRTLEDDVGMALAALTERAEKLQQQISGMGAAFEALQRTVDEKTNQGHREAEDIRTQLSPLLEAHGQRHAADERMLSEIDRLRESLADSLADLSEHLRRAVRGI